MRQATLRQANLRQANLRRSDHWRAFGNQERGSWLLLDAGY
ncbi:pentapeptide repeat-containing protein [Achromobacter sp. NFACC18-2]